MWAVCGNVNENDSNYRYRFTQPAIAGMGPGSTWIKEEQAQAVANKQLVDLFPSRRGELQTNQADEPGPRASRSAVRRFIIGKMPGLLDPLRLMEQVKAWADHARDPAALLANQVLERGEPPYFASPIA
jgi:hypothetical protein